MRPKQIHNRRSLIIRNDFSSFRGTLENEINMLPIGLIFSDIFNSYRHVSSNLQKALTNLSPPRESVYLLVKTA